MTRPEEMIPKTAWLAFLAASLLPNVGCNRPETATDSAKTGRVKKSRIVAQGLLLPQGGIIQLAAAPGDIVDAVHAQPGSQVKAGSKLLDLRSEGVLSMQKEALQLRYDQAAVSRQQTVDAAKLQLEGAQLKLEHALATRESVTESAELLAMAKQQVDATREMADKLERIASNDVTGQFVGQLDVETQQLKVSEAELARKTKVDEHRRALEGAVFAVRAAELEVQNAELALSGVQSNDSLSVIKKEIDALDKKMSAAQVNAPVDGTILSLQVSPGEATSAFPLIEMANLGKIVCEVEINEQDAGGVLVGQSAKITSRAFEKEMLGKVIQKYALVGKPQLRQLDPLARVDYRTITAVIELDEDSSARAKEWLQLQVKAEIELK